MNYQRLVLAFCFAVLGAAAMAEAGGKPSWAPPSDPPQTLLDYACSLLPDAAAAYVPFCSE